MILVSILFTFIISFTMIFFGLYLIKYPPKQINSVFGYRSRLSMKNENTWAYAHQIAGKLWLVMGVVMLPMSLIIPFIFDIWFKIEPIVMIQIYIQLVLLLMVIPYTEFALRARFTNDGIEK